MMSTWPKVQAVTGPQDSAEVVFDFTRIEDLISCTVAHAGWSIGSPSLEGDVDALHPSYTERNLTYSAQLEGSEHQALNAQSVLARWLLSGPGCLRFQLSPLIDPVTFRTYRAHPGDMSFEHVVVDETNPSRRSLWSIVMEIPAEAFAYGRKVTLDPITLSNNPAAATNPCRVVIPEVRGDAPAPFRFDVSDTYGGGGSRWMMSLHAGATPRLPVLVDIGAGDGLTAGADTGAGASGSSYVGGSARAVTFATDSLLSTRISSTSQPSGLTPGRWKVLLRVARQGGSGVHTFRFRQAKTSTLVVGATVASARANTAGEHHYWVDLGDFTFPAFGPPLDEPGGDFAASGGFAVQAGVPSGLVHEVRLDALLFVPLETPDTLNSLTLFTNLVDGLPYRGVWDGDLERFWAYGPDGLMGSTRPQMAGRFPHLIPGASNVIAVLRQVNGPTPDLLEKDESYDLNASDSIADAGTLTLSYYPRYLYIGQG